jgi:hypothetical protein
MEEVAVVEQLWSKAEYYVCSCMNRNPGGAKHNADHTPVGLLFIRPWNKLQYVSNAAFLLTVYSNVLSSLGQPLLVVALAMMVSPPGPSTATQARCWRSPSPRSTTS